MLFNLKRFWQTGQTPYTTQLECDACGFSWPEYSPVGAVNVTFVAIPKPDGLDIELSVSATVGGECARCLAPVQQSFAFTRNWSLKEGEFSGESIEFPINSKSELDIDDLAFQELLLELPPVLLCSADCEGLCQVCGKPVQAGCSCETSEEPAVDPRLAILKQLLD